MLHRPPAHGRHKRHGSALQRPHGRQKRHGSALPRRAAARPPRPEGAVGLLVHVVGLAGLPLLLARIVVEPAPACPGQTKQHA